ncbi:MAG TPA: LD-carboxypeptidase [Thermoanaerobaculia bacterium]|jgi:muramoyltetrapeptide carboxypeptidase|nr:LD-carboxypeptidase [Thermoanaerobaculia bacterium]
MARERLSRRRFGQLLALGGAAAAASPVTACASMRAPAAAPAVAAPRTKGRPPLLKPRHLSEGDTVGLILPASQAFEASTVDLAVDQLGAMGFHVKVGAHAKSKHGYLAGTDAERAADLMAAFTDPEVAAVVCFKGGWGTPRILPLLDFAAIRANPKPFVGYSDVTALLNAIHQETGLVTFHGPMAGSNLRPFNREGLHRALMSTEPIGTLSNPPKDDDELVPRSYRIVTLTPGQATGRVVGGNLTLVAALMGTPWEVDTDGAILLLEDVEEELYRIDRLLTQLALGGKLAAAKAIAFGYCTDCTVEGPSLSLEELLADHIGRLGIPAIAGLAFGHREKVLTIPIGLTGTLDATAGTLSFDEAAVT